MCTLVICCAEPLSWRCLDAAGHACDCCVSFVGSLSSRDMCADVSSEIMTGRSCETELGRVGVEDGRPSPSSVLFCGGPCWLLSLLSSGPIPISGAGVESKPEV